MLAESLKGTDVVVESAGLRALVGHPTTDETTRLALEHGLTSKVISAHRARLASEEILGDADLVLAMAREHRHAIVDLVPRRLRSTFTLRELARLGHEATDAELAEAAAGSGDPHERLRRVLAFVSSLRGTIDPPPSAADDDVVDPYRRPWDTYLLSTSQLVPAIADVARVIRVAAGGVSVAPPVAADIASGPQGAATSGSTEPRVGTWARTERHSWN
ncbi:arsenate reductase/protein-tyrosine-phosphatase family protein [Microbacterium sp. JZ31]|uniref:arsenate reductase/protein-tyrosine-phosphatase family protein n=1 Tax=Microbacterium sp. JZ31 TaxID=1906274 RepID=UPI001EE4B508|nr:low molecular weight phosphatase family protein [Microbacterium sp. JZ31]